MPHIVFVNAAGHRTTVEAKEGLSVMQAAIEHGIPEMHAECGGSCSCATCHVYLQETWTAVSGQANAQEDGMLDGTFEIRQPNSRLACQIAITAEMDGLVIGLPARQV